MGREGNNNVKKKSAHDRKSVDSMLPENLISLSFTLFSSPLF